MSPSGGKVLVVDDDKFVYLAVSTIFEKIGYDVLEANNGRDALRLAEEHVPRCIFLDIQMPGMDGYEVCSRIRQNPKTRDVPVIFVSARESTGGFDREVEAGGNFFVPKPFQPNDLGVDLYFLNELDFQPSAQDLPRLRVARKLEDKKPDSTDSSPVDPASTPAPESSGESGGVGEAVEEIAGSVEEIKERAKEEYQKEDVDLEAIRELRLLMLGTSYRLAALIRLLEEKGVLRDGEVDQALQSIMNQDHALKRDRKPKPSPPSEE